MAVLQTRRRVLAPHIFPQAPIATTTMMITICPQGPRKLRPSAPSPQRRALLLFPVYHPRSEKLPLMTKTKTMMMTVMAMRRKQKVLVPPDGRAHGKLSFERRNFSLSSYSYIGNNPLPADKLSLSLIVDPPLLYYPPTPCLVSSRHRSPRKRGSSSCSETSASVLYSLSDICVRAGR